MGVAFLLANYLLTNLNLRTGMISKIKNKAQALFKYLRKGCEDEQ